MVVARGDPGRDADTGDAVVKSSISWYSRVHEAVGAPLLSMFLVHNNTPPFQILSESEQACCQSDWDAMGLGRGDWLGSDSIRMACGAGRYRYDTSDKRREASGGDGDDERRQASRRRWWALLSIA